jgi:hypothetical protein
MIMKKGILGAISALLAATLACSIFVGGPPYPEGTTPISTETNQTLQDQIQQAVTAAAETGVISLRLTEGQLTSYLAAKVAEQSNPVITEPRVFLRSGQMKIYGKARSGFFTANVSITLRASIDENNQAQFQVSQTDFGPLAAPQGLNDALAAFVREAFTGWLGPVATGFRLESIRIEDGALTITGRVK